MHKLTAHQVESLRRTAKKMARAEGIHLADAHDRLAKEHGFKNWSLLQKNGVHNPLLPQPYVFRRTDDEMSTALRVVPDSDRWDRRPRTEIALSQTEDICQKFVSATNAIDFAISFVESVLRQKRFRIDQKCVAAWEMRCWLPYAALAVEGSTHVLVNRRYKPVGTTTDERVEYDEYSALKLNLTGETWRQFAWPRARDPFLYGDICAPWVSRHHALEYVGRLHKLRQQT